MLPERGPESHRRQVGIALQWQRQRHSRALQVGNFCSGWRLKTTLASHRCAGTRWVSKHIELRRLTGMTIAPPGAPFEEEYVMANPTNQRSPGDGSRRGFASMDERQQREIASKGGHSQGKENNPGNFANDRERAAEAGRKGGERQGRANNPGNFANDREKAALAGRHGGHARGGNH